MKKCFAFLLTLVLTLSLTACGSESRQLVGAWHGSILPGITQKLNSVVSEALGTEYTSEQEADLWLNAVFNKDGTFTITGSGSGHNLGMSQYGAKAMAELGYTYDEILEFYYTDITIK